MSHADREQGVINMDFTVQVAVNNWNLIGIKIGEILNIKAKSYFSDCTVVEKLNITMGRILIEKLEKYEEIQLNLDELCSDMSAGTKVPVKVFFRAAQMAQDV